MNKMNKAVLTIIMLFCLAAGPLFAGEMDSDGSGQEIRLSPELMDLLRAEMREIAGGMQSITLSLATANWQSIQEISGKIRTSYIMDKALNPAQIEELEAVLPEHFKRLDGAFHRRAEKLGAAAAKRDAEATVFHFSRMMENCTNCHATYARSRFPGYSAEKRKHEHH